MDQIKVTFYTDPLCCWSWAIDRHWKNLLAAYPNEIDCQYVMCGMIPDWQTYHDPMNSVTKPIQMGPVWMHASEVTQTKMKYNIWHEDPPASSFPACIAVKTAGLQSRAAEEQFLDKLRASLMVEGLNISKSTVLLSVAEEIVRDDFNFKQFEKDWKLQKGKDLFRADIQQAKYRNIGRFPTLTFQNPAGKGIVIIGYRPYDVLDQAMNEVRVVHPIALK